MGGTARCTRGVWDEDPDTPYAITYRWYRDGAAIPGATTNQLAITKDDIGDEMACAAIADAQTEARSEPQEVRPPELQNRPRPLGQPYPGRQLMCPRGEWNDSPDARYDVTSTWLRDGEPLLGYTEVYTLTADDVGHSFSCELTAEGEFKDETRSAFGSWQPVEMRYTPDDDAIAPGATNGYTVGFRNVNPVEASLGSVIVILPEGFRYRPQTTTGALTSEPSGSEENITWNAGGLKIPPGGEVSFQLRRELRDRRGRPPLAAQLRHRRQLDRRLRRRLGGGADHGRGALHADLHRQRDAGRRRAERHARRRRDLRRRRGRRPARRRRRRRAVRRRRRGPPRRRRGRRHAARRRRRGPADHRRRRRPDARRRRAGLRLLRHAARVRDRHARRIRRRRRGRRGRRRGRRRRDHPRRALPPTCWPAPPARRSSTPARATTGSSPRAAAT